ncbi:hypothetical protein Ciccas_014052 [Cichlidogyrus casuarinus]|uniref:Uncharacterized protein n=1 Tax=Cichlidogyrus casuarinus TaxID=1844966 RepID=A0ABD2PKR3_9PLAT
MFQRTWFWIAVALLVQRLQASDSVLREQIINELISSKHYKATDRPEADKPTLVRVNILIMALFSIDVRTMDYKMDMYLRQRWVESRLAWNTMAKFSGYNSSIVTPKLKESLWLPDLFFRNGKEGYLHKMTQPNYLLRLKPDGDILYSQKITMKFSCQMYLQTFPMDTQKCTINIGSYAYTSSELKFYWQEEKAIEVRDLQIAEFLSPRYYNNTDCTKDSRTTTGEYSCLRVDFELKRQIGYYLATTYIPNSLVITVSWLSFWVDVDAAPARVPLGLLSLLAILTQAASVSSVLPRVSYIKAIDVWLIFSIVFVIGVLVEYAIALTVIRSRKTQHWHHDVRKIVHNELTKWCTACPEDQALEAVKNAVSWNMHPEVGLEGLLADQVKDLVQKNSTNRTKPTHCEVDVYSRFLFPACFILYNCFYWFYYLVLVEILDQEARPNTS